VVRKPIITRRVFRSVGLVVLAVVSALAYAAIAVSGQSLHEESSDGHSLLVILGLFAVCFACYLAAVRIAVRTPPSKTSLRIILGGALVFRGLLLFADPIEEIDIYRYLWDGAVSTSGVNPFRYAPQQVLAADPEDDLPADLAKLASLRDRSPALAEVLNRVHFGELPTIYPPVSQAVFALAAVMTPDSASVRARMTIVKAWFCGFDLLTIVVVARLLRLVGRPDTAVTIYAWCPLVIKELTNSGHLDSLAVFLTTLSCYLGAKALFLTTSPSGDRSRCGRMSGVLWAAFFLGLAAGAKLYPVVLAPLLLGAIAVRRTGKETLVAALLFTATAAVVLSPMLPTSASPPWKPPASVEQADFVLPPLPPEEIDLSPRDPSQSLRAFLSYWEMNDFLFLLVVENVRPEAHLPPDRRAWFSVLPESWRCELARGLNRALPVDVELAPFALARILTAAVFSVLALSFARRAARSSSVETFLQHAFLTIAWFWLLLPTGNPWYWTWAMPLLPFARSRAWLTLSGLVMLYYLRFWLVHHFASAPVLGTGYSGALFFDYVVTWVEYGPWLAALTRRAIPTKGVFRSVDSPIGS
jgi:hypothetical protein